MLPPGKIETEITVSFHVPGRMVYPVHIRCYQKPSKLVIQRGGDADISAIKQGSVIQYYFESHYGDYEAPMRKTANIFSIIETTISIG